MPEIKLFGLGQQSKSPNITAAHRLNLYYDMQVDVDKSQVVAYNTPGLNLFTNLGASPTRGMHWFEAYNILCVVQRGNLFIVAPDGTSTRYTLSSTDLEGRVSIANNGSVGHQLCIVSGTAAYIYDAVSHAITNILTTGANPIPYAADTVTFLDGYFITNRIATGQFYISDVYNGLSWQGLNYATAESNPDDLMAVAADKGYLACFGTSSIELWANTGDQAFPFTRVNGSPSEGGLAARWSLSRCQGFHTGLFRNKQGALAVCQLQGYQLVPISTVDIDYIFNNYTTPSDAVGFGYYLNGRAFYQITFQAEAKSWLYDFQSSAWSQLKSWNISRHTGDMGIGFGTNYIVSDYDDGQLYYLDADAITDNGQPIERELTSGHIFSSSRNNMTIRRLRLDMEGGVGLISGQGTNPTIMLQISRDGGHTWGKELWTSMGKLGQFYSRAEWRRLGMARDWLFKLRITDPVKVVIIAAIIEAQELQS